MSSTSNNFPKDPSISLLSRLFAKAEAAEKQGKLIRSFSGGAGSDEDHGDGSNDSRPISLPANFNGESPFNQGTSMFGLPDMSKLKLKDKKVDVEANAGIEDTCAISEKENEGEVRPYIQEMMAKPLSELSAEFKKEPTAVSTPKAAKVDEEGKPRTSEETIKPVVFSPKDKPLPQTPEEGSPPESPEGSSPDHTLIDEVHEAFQLQSRVKPLTIEEQHTISKVRTEPLEEGKLPPYAAEIVALEAEEAATAATDRARPVSASSFTEKVLGKKEKAEQEVVEQSPKPEKKSAQEIVLEREQNMKAIKLYEERTRASMAEMKHLKSALAHELEQHHTKAQQYNETISEIQQMDGDLERVNNRWDEVSKTHQEYVSTTEQRILKLEKDIDILTFLRWKAKAKAGLHPYVVDDSELAKGVPSQLIS